MSCVSPPPEFDVGVFGLVQLCSCNLIIIIFYISYCVGLIPRILPLAERTQKARTNCFV